MKRHLFLLFLFIILSTAISFSQEVFIGKAISLKQESKGYLSKSLAKYELYALDISSLNSKISSEKI